MAVHVPVLLRVCCERSICCSQEATREGGGESTGARESAVVEDMTVWTKRKKMQMSVVQKSKQQCLSRGVVRG